MKRTLLIVGLVAALTGCAASDNSNITEIECTGIIKSGNGSYTVPIWAYNSKWKEYKAGGAFQGRWVEPSQFYGTDCPVK